MAVFNGHIAAVQALLAACMNANCRGMKGLQSLQIAARDGKWEIFRLLLQASKVMHLPDRWHFWPLKYAVLTQKLDIIKLLCEGGADIGDVGTDDLTIFMCAIVVGHEAVVKYLPQRKPYLEMRNYRGETALLVAAKTGQTRMIRLLLNASANMHATDRYRCTALMAAAKEGREEAMHVLMDAGIALDAVDDTHNTAAMCAVTYGQHSCASALWKAGASVHIAGDDGVTQLMQATMCDVIMVELACEAGADLDALDPLGRTVVHVAARGERPTDILRLLISYGASVTLADTKGNTPIIAGISGGTSREPRWQEGVEAAPGVVKQLLQAGGDVNIRNNKGRTALQAAYMEGDERTICVLLAAGHVLQCDHDANPGGVSEDDSD
jgi:ankyrin repeat protein